jgi:hypothetical protein
MPAATDGGTHAPVMSRYSGNYVNGESHKLAGGITGKGFVKGDPRCYRKGRPAHYDIIRRIAQQIAWEPAIDARGNNTTRVELMLYRWARTPALQRAFVEYAFGKVPDKVESTGLENKTTLTLYFDPERPGVIRSSQTPDKDNGASLRLKGP